MVRENRSKEDSATGERACWYPSFSNLCRCANTLRVRRKRRSDALRFESVAFLYEWSHVAFVSKKTVKTKHKGSRTVFDVRKVNNVIFGQPLKHEQACFSSS